MGIFQIKSLLLFLLLLLLEILVLDVGLLPDSSELDVVKELGRAFDELHSSIPPALTILQLHIMLSVAVKYRLIVLTKFKINLANRYSLYNLNKAYHTK